MDQPIALVIVVVYLVAVTLVGSLFARGSRSAKDWAVAGGGMSTIIVAFGIAGTRIGGVGTYGVARDVISGGTWNMWWYSINTILAMLLVGFFYGIAFRRLPISTVSEIFTLRFGTRRCQTLTSLCVQTEYVIVDVIEAYLIGVVLTALTGIPFAITVFIAAAILITYTSLGGLRGSAVTNLIHCAVIVVGLLVVAVLGMREIGGWDAVTQNVNASLAADGKDETAWWSFFGGGFGAIFGMFFSVTVHTPAASVYVNFAQATRHEKSVVPAFVIGGIVGATMPLLAGWIGIETLAKYGSASGISSYENITKIAIDISPVIGGIAIAAVLAAIISSGAPILLASATLFVQDWMPFTRDYSPERKLKTFRITTVIYGLVAATIAMLARQVDFSVFVLLMFGFAMVVPPAITLGYLLYWKRTTEKAAFWGTLLGYVGGLIWYILIKVTLANGFEVDETSSALARLYHFCFAHNGKGVDPSYATTFIPLILVPIISLMTPQETERRERFYDRLAGKDVELT